MTQESKITFKTILLNSIGIIVSGIVFFIILSAKLPEQIETNREDINSLHETDATLVPKVQFETYVKEHNIILQQHLNNDKELRTIIINRLDRMEQKIDNLKK